MRFDMRNIKSQHLQGLVRATLDGPDGVRREPHQHLVSGLTKLPRLLRLGRVPKMSGRMAPKRSPTVWPSAGGEGHQKRPLRGSRMPCGSVLASLPPSPLAI